MPTAARLYAIADTNIPSAAENAAVGWTVQGEGEGTFQNGARLSDDGGTTTTHRAANALQGDDGDLWDVSQLIDAFTNTPLFALYASGDRLGTGTVYRRDSGQWTEIGTGDLETRALEDAGLVRVEADPLD